MFSYATSAVSLNKYLRAALSNGVRSEAVKAAALSTSSGRQNVHSWNALRASYPRAPALEAAVECAALHYGHSELQQLLSILRDCTKIQWPPQRERLHPEKSTSNTHRGANPCSAVELSSIRMNFPNRYAETAVFMLSITLLPEQNLRFHIWSTLAPVIAITTQNSHTPALVEGHKYAQNCKS